MSVDVFDTVLVRAVARPETAFDLVGRDLERTDQLRVPAARFRPLRVLAEGQRRTKGTEANIEEIHDELATAGVVRDAATSLAAELAWERRLIAAVPHDVLGPLRARSPENCVLFISDTPLRAAFLRERLAALGLLRDGDEVVTSGDEVATKRSGALYERLLSQKGVDPACWLHAGNDERADVEVPRHLGLRTLHLPAGNLTGHEERLVARECDAGAIASVLAGAARMARIEVGQRPGSHEGAIASLETGVFGPTLAAFVSWLMMSAARDGVERLFFIARDGDTLLQFADELAPVLGVDVDRRYLYGSRQALNLPSLHEAGEIDLRARTWIFKDLRRTTLGGLARRVDLDVDAVRGLLGPLCAELRDDEPLGARASGIESALLRSDGFCRAVLARAAQANPPAVAYLRQIGLLEPSVPSAIVDLGWTGSMLRSLQEIAAGADVGRLPTYAYALHDAPSEIGPLAATAFAQDGRRSGQRLSWPHEALEAACVARHGPVVGYGYGDDGRPAPDVAALEAETEAWGGDAARRALRASAKWSAWALDVTGLAATIEPAELRLLGMPVLCRGMEEVDVHEAAAWGDFPHRQSQEHERSVPLAPPLRLWNAPRRRSGRYAPLRERRSSRGVRCVLYVRRALGRLRRSLSARRSGTR